MSNETELKINNHPLAELQRFFEKYPMVYDALSRKPKEGDDYETSWRIRILDENVKGRAYNLVVTVKVDYNLIPERTSSTMPERTSSTKTISVSSVMSDYKTISRSPRLITFNLNTPRIGEKSVTITNNDHLCSEEVPTDRSILQTIIDCDYAEPVQFDQKVWYQYPVTHCKTLVNAVLNKTRALDVTASPLVTQWALDDVIINVECMKMPAVAEGIDMSHYSARVTVHWADEELLTVAIEVRSEKEYSHQVNIYPFWQLMSEPLDADQVITSVKNANISSTDAIEGTSTDGEITSLDKP